MAVNPGSLDSRFRGNDGTDQVDTGSNLRLPFDPVPSAGTGFS